MNVLTFDATTHKYYYGIKELPSVTQILSRVLGNHGHGTQWHLDRGTAAHELYELLGKGEDLNEYHYDDRLQANIDAWEDWKSREGAEFELVESRFADPKNGYAGTIDAVVAIKGKRWIIDYKATSTMRDQLQLAAYKLLYEANKKLKIDGIASLQIKASGWKYGTRLEKLQMLAACRQWQSVLTVYRLLTAGF